MFFDTDLLVVVGVIFAVTAMSWTRSLARLAWAHATSRAEQASVVALPFAVAERSSSARKAVLRRMVPAVVAANGPAVALRPEMVVATPTKVATDRLSVGSQVARIAEIVTRAVEGARDADRLHHAAHEQLDAADYALQNLMHELSAVMSVPRVKTARPSKVQLATEVAVLVPFATALAA